jgi:hypothetical protein
MVAKVTAASLGALLAASAAGGFNRPASAESFVENSAETRMQLDLVVSAAALKKFLPDGFESVVATQGAAKDCNVRMIFIDRIDVTKQDGSPAANGPSQLVYLAAPVKQTSSNTPGQMIVYGITSDPKEAPGPFAVYDHATTAKMSRAVTANGSGDPMVEDSYEFATAGGEHMQIRLKYERGTARKGGGDTKFWSAKDPSLAQIFKVQQGLDIMRNATVPVKDRVKEFSYKGGGGKIASLFDGTEKVVSIDALHWYNRGVFTP